MCSVRACEVGGRSGFYPVGLAVFRCEATIPSSATLEGLHACGYYRSSWMALLLLAARVRWRLVHRAQMAILDEQMARDLKVVLAVELADEPEWLTEAQRLLETTAPVRQ